MTRDPTTWGFRGLIVLILGVILWCFRDFGIIWDEPAQHQYGQYVVAYYGSLFQDRTALTFLDAYLYGAFFDTVAALAVRFSPFGEFETRHLLNACVGLIGIAATWKLARLLAGRWAAFLAASMLLLEPSYFGHMFNNHKDIPFAAGYACSLYFLLVALRHFPAVPSGLVARLGLAVGLTLGVRIGGLLLLGYLGLAALLYCARPTWFAEGEPWAPRPANWLRALAGSVLGVFLISYAVMLLCWPWAQQNPVTRPVEALLYMSKFKIKDTGLLARVLLDGEYLFAKDLPASYLPHYFAVKLPELVLASVVLALLLVAWSVRRRKLPANRLLLVQWGLLLFAVIFPPAYAILTGAVLYDTHRHLLFMVPPLCVIGGSALARLGEMLARGPQYRRALAVAVSGLLLLPQAWAVVRLHPYQTVYYNLLAGGVEGASGRYEMDYWGNSYKEAVEILANYLRESEGQGFEEEKWRVTAYGPGFSAAYYFPENFEYTPRTHEADFIISFTRWGFHQMAPGRQIGAVVRMGATLAVITDRRWSHGSSRRSLYHLSPGDSAAVRAWRRAVGHPRPVEELLLVREPVLDLQADGSGLGRTGDLELAALKVGALALLEAADGDLLRTVFSALAIEILVQEHDGGPRALAQHRLVQLPAQDLAFFLVVDGQLVDGLWHGLGSTWLVG